ncbi:MAG: EthD domain-containing protein [Acidimicrobiia bacterium]
MITIVFCLVRKDDVSREDFQRYWWDEHGPLVARYAETLRIREYHQLHTRTSPVADALRQSRGTRETEFDGVALVWLDSLEDLIAAASTPEGQAAGQALLEDEQRFIDMSKAVVWLADDRPVVAESGTGGGRRGGVETG